MSRSPRWTTALAVALLAGVAAPACAPPTPTPPPLPPEVTVTELVGRHGEALDRALMLNERGQIVGTVPYERVVFWDDGAVTPIEVERNRRVWPQELSDQGQVVGAWGGYDPISFAPVFFPFSWSGGRPVRLAPADVRGWATSANERGQVVGWMESDSLNPPQGKAVVWQDGGVVEAPPEVQAGQFDPPVDINDRGQVLFETILPDDGWQGSAVWQVGGEMTRLRSLYGGVGPDEVGGVGRAINASGDVAGISWPTPDGYTDPRLVVWQDGEPTDLGPLGCKSQGGYCIPNEGENLDINDRGHVVGDRVLPDGERHAFLWRDGEAIDLGTLGGPESSAVAVNEHDQVVGTSLTADGEYHAFLWQEGGMTDLGALANPDATESLPTDINDQGQIVGWYDTDRNNPSTPTHAVMWTAPPPS